MLTATDVEVRRGVSVIEIASRLLDAGMGGFEVSQRIREAVIDEAVRKVNMVHDVEPLLDEEHRVDCRYCTALLGDISAKFSKLMEQ